MRLRCCAGALVPRSNQWPLVYSYRVSGNDTAIAANGLRSYPYLACKRCSAARCYVATNQQVSKVQQDRLELLARVGLKMAGFKPAHLRKAHARVVEALDAEVIKRYHDRDGVVTGEHRDPDHYARIAAARQIGQMIPGYYPAQGAGMERSEGNTINVQIILQNQDGSQHVVQVQAAQQLHNDSVAQTIEQPQ